MKIVGRNKETGGLIFERITDPRMTWEVKRKKYQESTSGPIDKQTRMFVSFINGGPLWSYEYKEYLKKLKRTNENT